ncbi:MAG: hypothetical protein ABSD71_05795 [Bacteroidales bacterium]|jgi:hypothetical protein
MDFTTNIYHKLLDTLILQGYTFQPFSAFLQSPADKVIILRHDVDARKEYSLRFAELEHAKGIHGSYYFRIVPQSFDEDIIKRISALGHEIGYHYETIDTVNEELRIRNEKFTKDQLVDAAYSEFCKNLEMFRKIIPIETICMHGSPRSKSDNRDIWGKYNYKALGIIGEPYFDIDFTKVAYLTDTGRRWNGNKVSVWDKVKSPFNFNFRTTNDIIRSVKQLPDKIMFTLHPQRWNDNKALWFKELIWQNLKNQVKYFLIRK